MGIAPDAQNTEIRSAYRTMSKLYHPDTTQLERVEANTLFVKLQDSYQTLSDSEKRRYYDWKLSLEVGLSSPSVHFVSAGVFVIREHTAKTTGVGRCR